MVRKYDENIIKNRYNYLLDNCIYFDTEDYRNLKKIFGKHIDLAIEILPVENIINKNTDYSLIIEGIVFNVLSSKDDIDKFCNKLGLKII